MFTFPRMEVNFFYSQNFLFFIFNFTMFIINILQSSHIYMYY